MQFQQYDPERFAQLICAEQFPLPNQPNQPVQYQALGTTWQVSYQLNHVQADVHQLVLHCRLIKGEAKHASVSLVIEVNDWQTDNYVLMPAALYNGNRFESRIVNYSPKLPYYAPAYRMAADSLKNIPNDIGKNVPPIISDVPRLNKSAGVSRVQLRSGDMSSPAIGIFHPRLQRACWLLTTQATELGDTGISLEESKDRRRAWMSFTAPVVRERYQYTIASTRAPSLDQGHHFVENTSFSLPIWLQEQPAQHLQTLFTRFTSLRKIPFPATEYRPSLPFGAAAQIMSQHMNHENWSEQQSYYSVGNKWHRWSPGWTGGFQLSYAMLLNNPNDTLTYRRVLRELHFALDKGFSPSGFFWDSYSNGLPNSGDYRRPHTHRWHLVRKSADGLYYALLMINYLDRAFAQWRKLFPEIAQQEARLQNLAAAFVRNWQQEQQLGQFVDAYTGEIIVGGSASGALVPAGLAMAAQKFRKHEYLIAAEQIMNYFDTAFVQKGYSNGGPGDALQNPDSESHYALLESAVALYEATRAPRWLQLAEQIAAQFASWVMPYNYQFPAYSTFGKLQIRTTGAVWANTQNKHGAPSICTHAGLALLKLYRYTGKLFYAELLKDIAFHAMQYISRAGHQIGALPQGAVNERCNTTDWLEGIGEVFDENTWAQIANLLITAQIPGLYITPQGEWLMFDHLQARMVANRKNAWTLEISNPTEFKTTLKIFVARADASLDQPERFRSVTVAPYAKQLIVIPKN
ncbi:MAG: hypothetical protein RMJ87_13915 [Cytophagales bacterium]|nr:hypothetical protein [Bernardetiaceae bacterium]MDW8206119.1 hypothetical protein [Cytophagales bacterium]